MWWYGDILVIEDGSGGRGLIFVFDCLRVDFVLNGEISGPVGLGAETKRKGNGEAE